MGGGTAKSISFVSAGFLLGLLAANIPGAIAEVEPRKDNDLSRKRFMVSIDEVKQNFVFAEQFSGTFKREFVLSNGQVRTVELTPMNRDGKQVVEFNDTGGVTYMGLSGTTTNGHLMVQLRDMDAVEAQLAADGWKR